MRTKNISFPLDGSVVLTSQEYKDFFSSQAALLATNKQICTSVTLTCGDENALNGLMTYLQQVPQFFSNNLIIHLEPTAFQGDSLQEALKLISDKGVAAVKLISKEGNNNAALPLLNTVKKNKLTVDIELWAGNEAAQQELDQCVSVFQRKKRIATFRQTLPPQPHTRDKNKPKRTRNKNTATTIDIDTEIEVQVEVAVEVAVEKAVEEQHEENNTAEFIDRTEFVRRAKAQTFKIAPSLYASLKGHEHRTWDCWMGNIHQAVVGPKKRRLIVGITRREGIADRKNFDYKFSIIEHPTLMLCCKYRNSPFASMSGYINHPLCLSATEVRNFIEEFFPEALNSSCCSKEFSDEEWLAAVKKFPPSFSGILFPLYRVDETELWKGEHVIDSDTLAEDQASLDALKDSCPIPFKNPEVSLRLFPNPKVSLMTPEACELLLAHQTQLHYGLDFEHLPAGFELNDVLINGKVVSILNYNEHKARLKRNNPYAIQLNSPEAIQPLAHDLFNQWRVSSKNSLLQQQYEVLEKTFDRQQIADFKRYLPIMLHLPQHLLTKFGKEAKDFIQAAIHHRALLSNIKGTLNAHLLGQFLEKDADMETIKALEQWHMQLNLTAADLNGLLAVYNSFGCKGLAGVFNVWEKACLKINETILDDSLLQSLKNYYFPQCESFVPLLDPSFDTAVNILKHLPQEERHFWDKLFAQHLSVVGYDELLPLVKAFQDFSTQIKEKNLVFYKDCHFSSVKNLQVALSRMLSILNNTPQADLQRVWEQITALDLQSNGAIRLLDDTNSTSAQGQWLLPDMKLSPAHYAEKHDFSLKTAMLPEHGYQALQVTHENPSRLKIKAGSDFFNMIPTNSLQEIIALSKNPEELSKNYYRYLSAQEHHLSLDFYQKAALFLDDSINNFEIRAGFYALTAAATSGFKASVHIQNEAEILKSIATLWELFNAIPLPSGVPVSNEVWRQGILTEFLQYFVPMAPFPYVVQLMAIVKKAYTLGWSNMTSLPRWKERRNGVAIVLDMISSLLQKNDYAFYDGLKFANAEHLNYEDYLKFIELASEINYSIKQSFAGSLIRLISTFQLNEQIIKNFQSFTHAKEFDTLLSHCLSLLTQMQTNSSPAFQLALTQADLLNFINYLKEQYALKQPGLKEDQFIIQCLQEKLSAYFAPDFFKKMTRPGLSQEIENQIKHNFETLEERNLVAKLLLSFSELKDKLSREEAIFYLIEISKRLLAHEKKSFLTRLNRLNAQGDNALAELNTLLMALAERGKVSDFIFIIEYAQQETEAVPHLIPKITRYYRQVRPFLYGKKREHLSLADLQPLAVQLVLNAPEEAEHFETSFIEVINSLEQVIDYCPNEKQGILALLSRFNSDAKNHSDFNLLSFVTSLGESAKFTDSSDIIRSLVDHYRTKPLELYSLFEQIKNPEEWDQRAILLMITSLLNNGNACPVDVIKEFLALCQQQQAKGIGQGQKSQLFLLSETFFKCPPPPTFAQIIAWHKEHQEASDYEEKMARSYQQYSLTPCEREPENGFKLTDAFDLASRFQGIGFEEHELNTLAKEIQAVKEKDTESLQKELNTIRTLAEEQQQQQFPRLLAILAELLYRSKGRVGGKGLSYEMNTVQYLAVLAFLKSKGHMTAEMATGEGKSRTMMMAIACQFALNKTVDFITSDMQLAQRDYLEYQAFFKILGAQTRLISSSSAASVYHPQGIHFSDASNLSLFRNKARSQRSGRQVIDPLPSRRALLLDEADRTYFDISETRFNYSDLPKDGAIKNMAWIYPFLARFFNQTDPQKKERCAALYEQDIEGCTAAFIEFIQAQPEYNEEMLVQIEGVPPSQLESWQEAAVTALNLKLGTDYTLEPNVLTETIHGPKLATEARLIYGHRLSKNSKFSFGVHQCLHAHLNNELQNSDSATSLKCAELMDLQNKGNDAAQRTVQPFFIHPEKQIVYSSTSKSFLDEYHAGDVWAITGSAGAILEKEEAAGLYGKNTHLGHAMEFITVPRKNNLQRTDHSLRLTGNFKQRVAAIFEYIIEARQSGRPVLLICEDDTQASLIRDALETLLKAKPVNEHIPTEQWQFVDSTSSSIHEEAVIANAGKPGVVTISTSRLGRGTDIKLSNESKAAGGLRVLGAYLPRERDQWQIFGRSGRYGDLGDTRLIVDKQQLAQQLGKKDLDVDFFLSTEFYIQSKQAHMDKNKQIERLIRNSLSDFRMKITDAFFNYYDGLAKDTRDDNKKAIDNWAQFTKKIDQIWNQIWPELDRLIKQPRVNISQVKAHLTQFKQQAQTEWNTLHAQLGADSKKLPRHLEDLKLDSRTEHLLRLIQPKRRYTLQDKTPVYKAYDKALDGRAVIYDELFTDLKAVWRGDRKLFANTRAWWNGHGILFADTRALLAGKRPLFATLRTWINKDKAAKKEQHIHCQSILAALEQHNMHALKHLLQHQEATQLLQLEAGDLLLSFKIQLIETILDYTHSQLEHQGKVTVKDMNLIHRLLTIIKETPGDEPLLISSMMKELSPLREGFFGRSLKKEMNAIIEQRQQEQTKSSNKP